ncbi:MAG: MarR family transcriptional regulator [Betaproteobacteria bacterium]|nr:MarR family transcriptional regulator [Betaproteobacteria bacterium]
MPAPSAPQVHALRDFNRFYTRQIGVLDPYLGSPFSLTEVRLLYELAHRDQPTAGEVGRALGLDAGYLSRLLARFQRQGWVTRKPSAADARQSLLALTPSGRKVFEPLQERSRTAAASLLAPLSASRRRALLNAMATIQRTLESPLARGAPPSTLLREHRPGDIGWVVQQHAELYAREYGWDQSFEALVAEIAARFLRHFEPLRERCWIAERDGERVGSVVLVRKSASVAQLRLLLVTPTARGLGIGAQLTDACIAFARASGYRKLVLWTHGNLKVARAIYGQRGFVRTREERYRAFGHELVSETWELRL